MIVPLFEWRDSNLPDIFLVNIISHEEQEASKLMLAKVGKTPCLHHQTMKIKAHPKDLNRQNSRHLYRLNCLDCKI